LARLDGGGGGEDGRPPLDFWGPAGGVERRRADGGGGALLAIPRGGGADLPRDPDGTAGPRDDGAGGGLERWGDSNGEASGATGASIDGSAATASSCCEEKKSSSTLRGERSDVIAVSFSPSAAVTPERSRYSAHRGFYSSASSRVWTLFALFRERWGEPQLPTARRMLAFKNSECSAA
jgi:hypothetical protein